jgi:hypothetical protein
MAEIIDISTPAALTEAVADVWRIPSPGPRNLLSSSQFTHLRDTCIDLYPDKSRSKNGLSVALANALRALGLPSELVPANAHLSLPVKAAAARLHSAFQREEASRVYLCPLDTVDELPELKFGPARIAKLTVGELRNLIDADRLRRINADWTFNFNGFAEFTWLVVRETVRFDREPGARAIPLLFERLDTDWARVAPHRQRVPIAVEDALFFLLLAPWEGWMKWPDGEWRGFRMPWVLRIRRRYLYPPKAASFSRQPILGTGRLDRCGRRGVRNRAIGGLAAQGRRKGC